MRIAILLSLLLATGCSHLGLTDDEFCQQEPSNEMCEVVDPLALDEEEGSNG